MSDKSPLFVSALELIAHATELYAQGKQRNYKFVILHLANAIELILKDRLVDGGVSIYKGRTSETINIWAAFDELDKLNVKAVKRPVIELLIDDRNTIQHRFGFPNAESVYYYLEHVVEFFKTFLDEQYGVDLAEALKPHLTKEHLTLLGLTKDEFAHLTKLMKVSPESAVVQAYKDLEQTLSKVIGGDSVPTQVAMFRPTRAPDIQKVLADLEKAGFLPPNSQARFELLRFMRNTAAHFGNNDPSDPKWAEALEIAKEIYIGLQKAIEAGFFTASDSATNEASSS